MSHTTGVTYRQIQTYTDEQLSNWADLAADDSIEGSSVPLRHSYVHIMNIHIHITEVVDS